MKKEKLIEELQKLPDGIEVCVFDWRKNLNDDFGDGSHAGIYPDFDISLVDLDSDDEKQFFKERHDKDFVAWVAIGFENDDYDEGGVSLIENE